MTSLLREPVASFVASLSDDGDILALREETGSCPLIFSYTDGGITNVGLTSD